MPETPKISPLSSEGIDPKMLVDMMVRARNGDELAVAYCNAFLKNAPSSCAEEDCKRPIRDEVVDIASDEDDDDDDDYDLAERIERDKKAREERDAKEKALDRRFGPGKSLGMMWGLESRTDKVLFQPWRIEMEEMYGWHCMVLVSAPSSGAKSSQARRQYTFGFVWADTCIRMAQFLAFLTHTVGGPRYLAPKDLHRRYVEFVSTTYFEWGLTNKMPDLGLPPPIHVPKPGIPTLPRELKDVYRGAFEPGRSPEPAQGRPRKVRRSG